MFLRSLVAASLLAAWLAPAFAESVLNRGNVAEPGTLDPQKYSTTYEQEIMRDLFEGLTTVDAQANPVAGAAESWTISPNGQVYTFKLRDGLVWSDGRAMTAGDFVYGMRRAIDPATHGWYASLVYKIKNARAVNEGKMPVSALGISAPDARTVVVELSEPSPILLRLLTLPMMMPAPKHVIDAHPTDWSRPGTMVTNGPFVLSEWRPNDHIKIVKNPRYRLANSVRLDAVNYFPTEDDATAVKRLRTGEIDLNMRFPPNEIDQLRKTLPPGTVRVSQSIGINYLVPNFKKPPFNDARVRRAMSLAIDREAIVERILRNGETPDYGLSPPGLPGYTPPMLDFKGRSLADRRAEARKLLAAAGYTAAKPLTFELSHRAGLANRRSAIAVADMLKTVGMKVTLLQTEVTSHYNKLRVGDFVVADAGWFGNMDPEYYTYLVLSGSTEANYGSYSNPAFDAKALEAQRTMDLTKRMQLFRAAETIALADNAIIPVNIYVNRDLVAPYVKGWLDNPLDFHPSRYLWIDKQGATANR